MNIVKIDEKYEEMKVREMGELELRGAQYMLAMCQIEDEKELYGEVVTTLESIDNDTFYCQKHLNYSDTNYIKGFHISSVFMIEGNYNVLFGIALSNSKNTYPKHFVVRFDYN